MVLRAAVGARHDREFHAAHQAHRGFDVKDTCAGRRALACWRSKRVGSRGMCACVGACMRGRVGACVRVCVCVCVCVCRPMNWGAIIVVTLMSLTPVLLALKQRRSKVCRASYDLVVTRLQLGSKTSAAPRTRMLMLWRCFVFLCSVRCLLVQH